MIPTRAGTRFSPLQLGQRGPVGRWTGPRPNAAALAAPPPPPPPRSFWGRAPTHRAASPPLLRCHCDQGPTGPKSPQNQPLRVAHQAGPRHSRFLRAAGPAGLTRPDGLGKAAMRCCFCGLRVASRRVPSHFLSLLAHPSSLGAADSSLSCSPVPFVASFPSQAAAFHHVHLNPPGKELGSGGGGGGGGNAADSGAGGGATSLGVTLRPNPRTERGKYGNRPPGALPRLQS